MTKDEEFEARVDVASLRWAYEKLEKVLRAEGREFPAFVLEFSQLKRIERRSWHLLIPRFIRRRMRWYDYELIGRQIVVDGQVRTVVDYNPTTLTATTRWEGPPS